MGTILTGQTLLNQFRVDEFVGTGGMGIVFRVWDLKRNTHLAMKVLHTDMVDDPAIFKLFQREARALERLAHPNIVPFYGLHKTRDLVFLLERYIDGPSLKNLLKQRKGQPLSSIEMLTYLKAVCATLSSAHVNGVIHCDVKPGNIMIDQGGNIYMTDFGIARHSNSTTTTIATSGTPAFMSPEQIRGEPVTPATDVYALGVMIFEMLTGQRPFRGGPISSREAYSTPAEHVRNMQISQLPPDPRSLNPGISPTMAGIILKALEKYSSDRFRNTMNLFTALCEAVGITPEDIPDRITRSGNENPLQLLDFSSPPANEARIRIFLGKGLPFIVGSAAIIAVLILYLVLTSLMHLSPTNLSEASIRITTTISITNLRPIQPSPKSMTSITIVSPTAPNPSPEPVTEPSNVQFQSLETRPSTVSPAPTQTPRPVQPQLVLQLDSFCRGGPGTGYDKIWTFSSGTELTVVGKDGDWWLVQLSDSRTRHDRCWINDSNGTATGNGDNVPFSDYRTEK